MARVGSSIMGRRRRGPDAVAATTGARQLGWASDALLAAAPERRSSLNGWSDPCYYHPASAYVRHAGGTIASSPRISFADSAAAADHTLQSERARRLNNLDQCYRHPHGMVTIGRSPAPGGLPQMRQLRISAQAPPPLMHRRPTPRPTAAQAALCRAFTEATVAAAAGVTTVQNATASQQGRPALQRSRSGSGRLSLARRRSQTLITKGGGACGAARGVERRQQRQQLSRRWRSMPNLLHAPQQ
jgi:hypothetical protein